jgi:membrane protein YdbS with pleckstrin-like domain
VTRIERFLADDEEIDLLTRRHIMVLMRPIVRFVLVTAVVVGASLLLNPGESDDWIARAAGVVSVLFFLPVAWGFLRWLSEGVAVTERRVVAVTGLLRRKVTSIPLGRVRNVDLDRGVGGRILRYGDIVLDLGEQGTVVLERIPRPKDFYRLLAAYATGWRPGRPVPDDEEGADTGPLPRVIL